MAALTDTKMPIILKRELYDRSISTKEFLGIPVEIRNLIYQFYFTDLSATLTEDDFDEISEADHNSWLLHLDHFSEEFTKNYHSSLGAKSFSPDGFILGWNVDYVSLMLICKQISVEAREVMLLQNVRLRLATRRNSLDDLPTGFIGTWLPTVKHLTIVAREHSPESIDTDVGKLPSLKSVLLTQPMGNRKSCYRRCNTRRTVVDALFGNTSDLLMMCFDRFWTSSGPISAPGTRRPDQEWLRAALWERKKQRFTIARRLIWHGDIYVGADFDRSNSRTMLLVVEYDAETHRLSRRQIMNLPNQALENQKVDMSQSIILKEIQTRRQLKQVFQDIDDGQVEDSSDDESPEEVSGGESSNGEETEDT